MTGLSAETSLLARARRRTFEVLNSREGDLPARIAELGILGLVALNVAAVIAGSVESIRTEHAELLRRFELLSVAVFSVEYVLRFWSAPEDPRYATTFGRLR